MSPLPYRRRALSLSPPAGAALQRNQQPRSRPPRSPPVHRIHAAYRHRAASASRTKPLGLNLEPARTAVRDVARKRLLTH